MIVQKTVPFLIFLASALSACSGQKAIVTPATDHQKSVDGNLTGWNLEQSIVEQTDAADYYATHDNEYLYILVDVKSPAHNNAISKSGLIIYMSSNEDERKKTGITFPSGSFNLLRENPGTYNSFLNDREWLQDPQNRELLESLETEIFDRIMIVEESAAGRDYGFLNKDQLQIDGIKVAKENSRRLMSIEMRVPVNENSFFNLDGETIWLGFEVDPPKIRLEQQDQGVANQRQQFGNRRGSNQQASRQMNYRRQMGEYEEWYLLRLTR